MDGVRHALRGLQRRYHGATRQNTLRIGTVAVAAVIVVSLGLAGCEATPTGQTPPAAQQATAVSTATDTPTPKPTDTPTPQPTATPTEAPTATARPATPTPRPAATATTPTKTGVNGNPWGFDFNPGSKIYDPPSGFCGYFPCISSFWDGDGYVVQCTDGKYSRSGGQQGECSRHGGAKRILYSH